MARPVFAAPAALAEGVPGVTPLGDRDDAERTLAAVRRRGGLVLADPGPGDHVAVASRAMGSPVAFLPSVAGVAGWIVAAAGRWRRDDLPAAVHRVEAVISVAVGAGATDCVLAAPDAASLVCRWAHRAWRPCRWCAGGGVRGARCARCRAPIGGGR
ncbi:MAG: hypothetical protein KDC33_12195 [Thermoleophilia bacterium]|nr:hypothetical protein [Thermoleophilia bacterium]